MLINTSSAQHKAQAPALAPYAQRSESVMYELVPPTNHPYLNDLDNDHIEGTNPSSEDNAPEAAQVQQSSYSHKR
jgi:hypothetical protein